MQDQRNLILAVVASLLIFLGFQYFIEAPRQAQRKAELATQQALEVQSAAKGVPAATIAPAVASNAAPAAPRLAIHSDQLSGSLSLAGGRFDDLTLEDYRATTAPDSPKITLLAPLDSAQPYFAQVGWTTTQAGVALPTDNTVWSGTGTLTPTTPVTLRWDNDQGLVFKRTVALDAHYMFTIEDSVENHTGAPVTLYPYAYVARLETPATEGQFGLHEGPVGVIQGTLQEHYYDKLRSDPVPESTTRGGWFGITDKYWLTAIIPDQGATVTVNFRYAKPAERDQYKVDYLGQQANVAPGDALTVTHRIFAGAKVVQLVDDYRDKLGIERFDLAVDFGWFSFLAKPIFFVIDFFYKLIGNFGVAILLLTMIIKILFFPLANKSYRSMSKMKLVQPKMQELKERYGDDKARMQQELMELYKREKINPLAGCVPILIQIPVFFSLYKVLSITIEMRHAPFVGWIHDLSAPDPTHILNLFGLIPWEPPHMLAMGAWPLIMGVTMWAQQKLNPAPPDPIQARVFMLMPIVFTFMLASFPAGLVIYWTWNNLLSIGQQWLIMRRTHLETVKVKS